MKKSLVCIIIAVVLVTACITLLSGCNLVIDGGWFDKADFLPEYESGYFRYAVKTLDDGAKEAYVVGLTESGLQQSVLIFPNEIDGITVYGTTYRIESIMITGNPKYIGKLDSENLEKIFFIESPSKVAETSVILTMHQSVYKVFWNIEDDFVALIIILKKGMKINFQILTLQIYRIYIITKIVQMADIIGWIVMTKV